MPVATQMVPGMTGRHGQWATYPAWQEYAMSTQCFLSMLTHWTFKLEEPECNRICGQVLRKLLDKGLPTADMIWWASLEPEACSG